MDKNLNLYGVYPAVVVNTNDPKGKGRISLRIASVLGSATSEWASPLGEINTPVKKGDAVLAQFIGGDVTQPVFSVSTPTSPWQSQIDALNQYPSTWQSLAPYYRGGISAFVGSSNEFAPQWRYEAAHTIKMRGALQWTSSLSDMSLMLDLTQGTPNLTPAHGVHLEAVSTYSTTIAARVRVDIETTGLFTIRIPSGSGYAPTWISLDSIIYDLV